MSRLFPYYMTESNLYYSRRKPENKLTPKNAAQDKIMDLLSYTGQQMSSYRVEVKD